MTIVVDSSILIPLAAIGQLLLLQKMYGGVFITQKIYDEVVIQGAGKAGAEEVKNANYIHVKQLQNPENIENYTDPLSSADASVIVLAKEMSADLILSRDGRLRRRASKEGVPTGTAFAFIIDAKHAGFIPAVKPLLDEMKGKGTLINEGIYSNVLCLAGEALDA